MTYSARIGMTSAKTGWEVPTRPTKLPRKPTSIKTPRVLNHHDGELQCSLIEESGQVAGIYKIVCSVNNDLYIGSTSNLYARFRQHATCAFSNDRPMYCRMRDVGVSNYRLEVIAYWEDDKDKMLLVEKLLQLSLKPNLNIYIGKTIELGDKKPVYTALDPYDVKAIEAIVSHRRISWFSNISGLSEHVIQRFRTKGTGKTEKVEKLRHYLFTYPGSANIISQILQKSA